MYENKVALWKETLTFLSIYFVIAVCFKWYPQNSFAIVLSLASGIIPIILFWINDEPICKLGFKRDNLLKQIFYGVVLAIITFLMVYIMFLMIAPIIEIKEISLKYVIYNFINSVFVVGFGEEILWRGYFLGRFRYLFCSDFLAIMLNAILFGVLHFVIHGNIIQMCVTFVFALIVSIAYIKCQNYTMISLIVTHGLYDFFIHFLNM